MIGKTKQEIITVNRATAFVLILTMFSVIVVVGCSINPKDRLNPLDSANDETGYDPFEVVLIRATVETDTDTTRIHHIEWRDIPHAAIEEYHMFRRQANLPQRGYIFMDEFDVGDTCFDDSTFDPRVKYYYRVTALFSGGEDSIRSAELEASRWFY